MTNPIDQQLEAICALIRANGGKVGIDPEAPDEVKLAFIRMLLECPDCAEMFGGPDGSAN
jgi:hypothetical protein